MVCLLHDLFSDGRRGVAYIWDEILEPSICLYPFSATSLGRSFGSFDVLCPLVASSLLEMNAGLWTVLS